MRVCCSFEYIAVDSCDVRRESETSTAEMPVVTRSSAVIAKSKIDSTETPVAANSVNSGARMQSETDSPETPATGNSLLHLEPEVWVKTCEFLPLKDMATLHTIRPTTFTPVLRTVLAKRRFFFDIPHV